MFDHVAPTVFWPLFMLFWLALGMAVAYLFGRWVDAGNPMRNTRKMIDGRKQMATDWQRPDYLPDDWK